MRFSPCCELFFTELPFPERLELIANLGFSSFEFWTWWDKDIRAVEEAAERLDLEVAGFCTPFIPLTDSARREEFLDGLEKTADVCSRLGCSTIIAQVGNEVPELERDEQLESIVQGLRAAAPIADAHSLTVVIEPLNIKRDHPGYFLSTTEEACRILGAVAHPRVGMLFDVYHQQVTEGDLLTNLRHALPWIRHVHIADCPGRDEIGHGEINFEVILRRLKEWGYSHPVGIELFPTLNDHTRSLSDPVFRAFSGG